MAVVNVGYPCNDTVNDWAGSSGYYEDITLISLYNTVSSDSTHATFCTRIMGTEWPDALDFYIQFAFFEKEDIGGGNFEFTRKQMSEKVKITMVYNGGSPASVTWTADNSHMYFKKNSDSDVQQTITFGEGDIILTKLKEQTVEALENECVGIIISGAEQWSSGGEPGYWTDAWIDSNNVLGEFYFFEGNDYSYSTATDPFFHDTEALALSIVGVGGVATDACHDMDDGDTDYWVGQTINGWGSIHIDGISSTQIFVDLITPWGESLPGEVLDNHVLETYHSDNGKEHWSVRLDCVCFTGMGCWAYDPYECWWTDKSYYFVKTGGSDSDLGINWGTAFKTITKGAQTCPNGGGLFIEEGTYNNETQIEPTVANAAYIIQPASHTEAPCTVTVNLA